MGASFGSAFKITVFGESHGDGVGVIIEGIPAGFNPDFKKIKFEMNRRRPGVHKNTTSREEQDNATILSGYHKSCTGAPLTVFIPSNNKKSKDYSLFRDNPRPSHSDYPAHIKYKGFNDIRGGGIFSARLTAPIVYAGAIAKQILEGHGVFIGAHILQIGNVKDRQFNALGETPEYLGNIAKKSLPVCNDSIISAMNDRVSSAKNKLDSIGGIIECMLVGVNAGIGEPIFNSIESQIAKIAFSIPGVKGVEFGQGFQFALLSGSEANDCYYYEGDDVRTYSNNNGGVLGGISNSMPIIFKTVLKPTSSIGIEQNTVNLSEKCNSKLTINGRHDPCIVLRAVPVIEAVAAIALLDLLKTAKI